MPHELGHALGLLHTHQPESTDDDYTSELVTRSIPSDESNPCSCNCLSTADRICDTPPDPYIQDPSTNEEIQHNQDMFEDCEMANNGNITDACGELYNDPDTIVMYNVMSYHCKDFSKLNLTNGQNNLIRMTMDNGNGSFKFQHDPTTIPLSQGLTVNSTMIISTDEAYNGDIIVNSDLTIENCIVELTEGHKIVVNSGANLTIRNAVIRTYSGNICYNQKEGKLEWEGIEINPSYNSLTSISVYSGSTIDISESGIYNSAGSAGLLNLAYNNSTLNGPAITVSNTIGVQKLLKSNFNSTVSVKDNFYLGVEGSSFDF